MGRSPPSVLGGDNGELGNKVGPLAALPDADQQVDHPLDALVVEHLQLSRAQRVERRACRLLEAADDLPGLLCQWAEWPLAQLGGPDQALVLRGVASGHRGPRTPVPWPTIQ
eukprot:4001195-Pyramimonas_sp.AAC.1